MLLSVSYVFIWSLSSPPLSLPSLFVPLPFPPAQWREVNSFKVYEKERKIGLIFVSKEELFVTLLLQFILDIYLLFSRR